MAFTPGNLSLRDREWHKFAGAAGTGSETSINVTISSGNITIGSVSANVDSIYVQSGALWIQSGANMYTWCRSGNVQPVSADTVFGISGTDLVVVGSHALSEAITVPPVLVGQRAESTVPTEVSDADMVAGWYDTFGRQIIKGTDLGQECISVNEIAPSIIQTLNSVNLNAVGSATGSNLGAWVNVSDFRLKTIYYNFTSGVTGSMMTKLEASPDAGSTAFAIGSQYWTADAKIFATNADHHEYLRLVTTFQEGGTMTATITGRGA
jgi:hypothetical protein